jgi:hypothetical protein
MVQNGKLLFKKGKKCHVTLFVCAPFGYLYFLSFLIMNEPVLGAGINPGMAFDTTSI